MAVLRAGNFVVVVRSWRLAVVGSRRVTVVLSLGRLATVLDVILRLMVAFVVGRLVLELGVNGREGLGGQRFVLKLGGERLAVGLGARRILLAFRSYNAAWTSERGE